MNSPAVFPGYPDFIASAASDLPGVSDAAIRAALRQPAVNQISLLVCQLRPGDPLHPDTARVLNDLRDGLVIAAEAGQRMIAFLGPVPEENPLSVFGAGVADTGPTPLGAGLHAPPRSGPKKAIG